MRIVFIIDSLGTGGAEFSTLSIISYLAKHESEVRLVTLKDVKPSFNIADFSISKEQFVSLAAETNLRGKFSKLAQLIRKFKPQIVHTVLFNSGVWGKIIKVSFPSIIHVHSYVSTPYSVEKLKNPRLKDWKVHLLKFGTQLSNRWVDHFNANSNEVAAHIQKHLLINRKDISIIYRGRMANTYLDDSESRLAFRQEMSIADDTLIYVNTGRHVFAKGQDTLIKAFSIVYKKLNSAILIIVGREDEETDQLKELISSFGLDNHVILLGFRKDVPIILAASDVFVFPSRYEGMPGALLEAYAAKLPVAATSIPPIMEVLIPGKNGLVSPVDDYHALAKNMLRLGNDKKLMSEFGRNNLCYFSDEFTQDKIMEQYKVMYENLVN